VVYDFCAGRGGKYSHAFLKDWSGTLVVDAYVFAAHEPLVAPIDPPIDAPPTPIRSGCS